MRRALAGPHITPRKPLQANKEELKAQQLPPSNNMPPISMMQQPAPSGLSVRKPMAVQQRISPGINARKPISATPPSQPQQKQQSASAGLSVRKPLEAQTILPQINARKPMSTPIMQTAPPPSIHARKPIDASSMMNCVQPTIRARGGIKLQQQQQPQPVQQPPQPQPPMPQSYATPPMYQNYAQPQVQQLLEQQLQIQLLQQLMMQQQQQMNSYGGPVPVPVPMSTRIFKGVDPAEEAKLRDLLASGFINDAEYAERIQALQETEEIIQSLGGTSELSLDAFGESYFPSDEAVYAADGEALILDDFVSSFLFTPEYGSTLKPEDFVSSELRLEMCGEAPRENNKTNTRSARTKVQLGENRNVRVFISSTFRDMVEERDELLKYVFPKLRKFCNERGVFLTQVDLRWGITNEQSKAGDTINICLGEVDRCRPYFIGLLGERYGWAQPDDSYSDQLLARTFERGIASYPWVANYKDRSITELEIRHAVLNDLSGRAKEHALFYFRDPAYLPADPQDFKYKEKLDSLKREIRLCGSEVKDYKAPKEVADLILNAMTKMLDKDFPLKEMPTPLQKERMAHDAFAATRASVYIGRQYYFDEITKHLSDTNCKPFVIVGDSGSGKSALTCNWTLQYKNAQQHKLVVAHYIGCTSASTDLSNLLRRVMGEIKERYSLDKEIPRDLPGMIEGFSDWLSEAGQRGGMVLVLDALNQLEDRGQGDVHDLQWLPREFPNGVQLIVSTLPGRCLNALNARGWPQLRVEPLSPSERTILVEEYMAQFGKSLTKQQLDKIVSAKQCQNPLFLRTLMEEIRVFGVFEQLDSKIDQYLTANTPPELFNLVFTRLQNDFAPKDRHFGEAGLIGSIMGLLWVSRRGLTETELLEILDLPHSVWSPLHIAMDEYIISRSGVLTFFHDYMRQAVEARYVKNTHMANAYREQLIAYFGGKTGKEILPARKCEEVPYQLLRSSNWNALAECITDLNMFLLLFTEEYKFDLYRYWQEAAKYVPSIERMILSKLEAKESQGGNDAEISDLLCSVGKLLQDLASYETAEALYQKALSISERLHSDNPEHPDIAQKLDGLAYMYRMAGKYMQAAPLYERAMVIREKVLGNDNPEFASSVNSLAILYRQQGKYEKAEPLYLKALGIREKLFGNTHADVAQSLNSLGCLCQDTGRYKESEDFFLRAVSMRETLCGPNHPDVAMSLNNLAGLYMDQSRYEDARPVYKRALEIYESVYGPIHPSVASTINSMAGLAQEEGKYDEAAKLYQKTLGIKEKLLGSIHPELALTLNDYAVLYARQDRYEEAEPLYQRALTIRAQVLGTEHPDYAQSLNNLGSLYQDMGRYYEALDMFENALRICEASFGEDHMDVAGSLTNIAGLYQFIGRHSEAIPLYTRALSIYEVKLGPNHADVAVTLNDLAVLHFNQRNMTEAEKLYKKALETYEAVFGKVHPDVAQALCNLGEFYRAQGDHESARAQLERAISIYTSMFGAGHPKAQAAKASLEALEGL